MTAIHSDETRYTGEPIDEVKPTWTRVAAIAGIAYVIIFAVAGGGIASSAPVLTDGADEIRTWFGDNQNPIAFFTWLANGIPLVLLFASGLRSRLTPVDPSGGILTRMSDGGAVATFSFALVALGFWGVMSLDPVLEGASDGLLVTLSALDAVVFFVVAPWAMAVFIVPASVILLMTRTMPAWLGALGCLCGLLFAVSGLWILDGDPTSTLAGLGSAGGLGSMLWILITSVFMIRSPRA